MSKTVMTKKESSTQEGLVPRLRFPEFVESGEWEEKRLGDDFDFLSTATNSRADLSETGDTFYIHYGDIHTKFNAIIDFSKNSIPMILRAKSKRAQYIQEGDIVLADASEDIEGVGKVIEAINVHKHNAIAGLHTFLLHKKNNNFAPIFCAYMFQCAHIRRQFAKIATGTKVYSISKATLREVSIYNFTVKEQQKIASCLSSLDTIITAQEQKIKKLEDHKKGLMQKLFPKQGESVPALRFVEFVDGGEWEEKALGQVAVFCGGGTPSRDKEDFWQGTIPWISSSDIYKDNITCLNISRYITDEAINASATKICPTGSILLVTRVGVGKLAIAPTQLCTSQDFTSITQTTENNIFLAYFLLGKMNKEANSSQGTSIKGITTKELKKIIIFIPSLPEQQRIADCLTSLDELIAAHRKKLNLLKEHKKGLMQGLFPVGKA